MYTFLLESFTYNLALHDLVVSVILVKYISSLGAGVFSTRTGADNSCGHYVSGTLIFYSFVHFLEGYPVKRLGNTFTI